MAESIIEKLKREIHKIIVGQEAVVDLLLTCLFANGHSLITGVPGLAKTLLARTVASTLGLKFQRIQFTPDLMPLDILGTEVLRTHDQNYDLEWIDGPVFTHLLLADEINRATPRTQSALLQAMQEKEIHVLGRHFKLERPFLVIATRNPLEQEGTFPLPEAQLDRFLMNIEIDYPNEGEEVDMLKMKGSDMSPEVSVILTREELLEHQHKIYNVAVSEEMLKKIVQCVQKTRPQVNSKIKDLIYWGAGPRASEALLQAGRAYAYLKGDGVLDWDHIRAVAPSVLNHRLELQIAIGPHHDSKGQFIREILT